MAVHGVIVRVYGGDDLWHVLADARQHVRQTVITRAEPVLIISALVA